ncbi:DUF2742 domain-containing protein [Streptomyces microflavus]|uniref:DUF2742 domain-containing protein n=1 Tax=Streptomyces microflavus TaxID=1919 RepID=UPI00332D6921
MNTTPEPAAETPVAPDPALGAFWRATRRRREAAARCEPLVCGHRDPQDCRDQCGETELPAEAPAGQPASNSEEAPGLEPELGDIVQLWADAKILYLATTYPLYGSPPWRALAPDSPERLAAVLDAAEKWRKYGDDIVEDLTYAMRARPPISSGRPLAEYDEAAKPHPSHQLTATPGWPPIAVPGKPGRYLTYTQQRREAA